MNEYEVGDVPRIQFDFKSLAGAPVDPASVQVTVTKPDGSVSLYTTADGSVVNDPDAVGRFYCDHEITQIGVHRAKAIAVSPKSAATVRFTSVG